MAEKEVLFKLTVKGNEESARGAKQVGDAYEKTSKQFDAAAEAARRLEKAQQEAAVRSQMGRMDPTGTIRGGGAAAFDPAMIAQQRMQKQLQEERIQREMQRMNPGGGPGAGGMGMGGFGKGFAVLAGAQVASQAFAGAASGLKNVAGSDVTGLDSMGALTKEWGGLLGTMVDGLPIIGNLKKGVEDLTGAFSGTTAELASLTKFAATSGQRIGATGQEMLLRRAGAEQEAMARRGVSDAGAEKQAAMIAAGRLTPDMLASFRPEVVPGLTTAGMGQARVGVAEAQTALDAAQRIAASRQREFANAGGVFAGSEAGAAGQNAAAVLAGQAANRAGNTAATSIDFGGSGVKAADAALKARNEELKLLNQGKVAEADRLSLAERRTAVMNAQNEVARKEFELTKANLAVDRERLNADKEQIGILKGSAQQIGFGQPGQAAALRATVAQIDQFGEGSASAEQLAELNSNQMTSRFAGDIARRRGLADPDFQALQNRFGDPTGQGRGLEQIEQAARQAEDALAVKAAAAAVALKGAIEKTKFENVDAIVASIKKGVNNALADIATKLRAEVFDAQAKGLIQGKQ